MLVGEDAGAKVLLVRLNKHCKNSSATIALLIAGNQQSNDGTCSSSIAADRLARSLVGLAVPLTGHFALYFNCHEMT
jgi:hypothetical protein